MKVGKCSLFGLKLKDKAIGRGGDTFLALEIRKVGKCPLFGLKLKDKAIGQNNDFP
jgi:hypothetical protein